MPTCTAQTITVSAYDLTGQEIEETVDGLFARAVQHETDHLNGVLFIDRLSPTARFGPQGRAGRVRNRICRSPAARRDSGRRAISARLAELEELRHVNRGNLGVRKHPQISQMTQILEMNWSARVRLLRKSFCVICGLVFLFRAVLMPMFARENSWLSRCGLVLRKRVLCD